MRRRRRRSCWIARRQSWPRRANELNDVKKAAAELKVPVKSSDLVGQDGRFRTLGAMSGRGRRRLRWPGSDLRADQRGPDGVVLENQEPTVDEIAEELRRDTREAAEHKKREEVFRRLHGNADGSLQQRRRRQDDQDSGSSRSLGK